ncbi:hypothetical protein G6F46_005559 [Rhizopus delemar]|uniref:Tc1-like transposase DDE domain-containing protein n=2 Tax=Rhizopus TaxID=4842 RepID=A0A9P6Z4Y7_9FUNG|nr:hypothetical protein G6F55_007810 [Rhizopus delemar]KAG1545137.1 hypothetical protein G6F51_005650 [Rhizopus arrhizus]KAG1498807.1 hypothetical protein G6F54_004826 [Rhizopus delemar]KAG1512576.1 hypothetical protein G6F53_005089 [Rhizopus delemar]KAG1525628.1 hypothetical protein G6F52_003157 [Rhizopus delemar]
MSVQISKDCTRLLVMSEDETKEKIAKLVGLNKFIMRGIKAKIDNYVSPLSYKQTGCPLKINERTEGHLKRIIRKDPVDFYDEINMESAKLDVFVCIETLRSYVDQLAFKSYRAAHKPRLTARHRKSRLRQAKEHLNWTKDQWRNVVWPDESCFLGVMVVLWFGDVFWGGGFGPLEIIETGSVDQETCINILANRFHPWFTNVTLHQERWLCSMVKGNSPNKGFEYWPAQSSDLSPIEHVWNALERRIERKRSSVKNLEQLKVALREERERMDDEFADRLVRSMKRRCEGVIKAKGDVTEN